MLFEQIVQEKWYQLSQTVVESSIIYHLSKVQISSLFLPEPQINQITIKQYNQPNLTYPNFYFQDTLTERVLRQQRWRVLNVTETIYYATLNHSSPQVIPLFSHNLLQKCVQKMPFQPYQCHPHFDTMPNSSKYLIFEPSSE